MVQQHSYTERVALGMAHMGTVQGSIGNLYSLGKRRFAEAAGVTLQCGPPIWGPELSIFFRAWGESTVA